MNRTTLSPLDTNDTIEPENISQGHPWIIIMSMHE